MPYHYRILRIKDRSARYINPIRCQYIVTTFQQCLNFLISFWTSVSSYFLSEKWTCRTIHPLNGQSSFGTFTKNFNNLSTRIPFNKMNETIRCEIRAKIIYKGRLPTSKERYQNEYDKNPIHHLRNDQIARIKWFIHYKKQFTNRVLRALFSNRFTYWVIKSTNGFSILL